MRASTARRRIPLVGPIAVPADSTVPLSEQLTTLLASRWALAGTLAIGLGLRVWGVAWQLPWIFHNDEDFFPGRAIRMLTTGELNPGFFQNPQFFTYLLMIQYWVMAAVATLVGAISGPEQLLDAYSFTTLFVIARLNTAVFGVLTMLAVYRLAALCAPRPVALLAAAFLATNLLHVRDSHFATNDIGCTMLLVACIIASVMLARAPTLRNYVLVGVFGGLASGFKYSMGLFFVSVLIAHLFAWGWRSYHPIAVSRLLIAGLVSVTVFLATNPYSLLDHKEFQHDFAEQVEQGSMDRSFPGTPDPPAFFGRTVLRSAGMAQVALALIGFGWLLLRDRRTVLVVCGFPVVYAAFMAYQEIFLVRYAIPIVPFLCLFAAAGVWCIVRAFGRQPRLAMTVALVLVVGALYHPTRLSIAFDRLMVMDDTRVVAARWMSEHLAGKGKVVADMRATGLLSFGASPMPGVELRRVSRVFQGDDRIAERGWAYMAWSVSQQNRYVELARLYEGREPHEQARKGVNEARRAVAFIKSHTPIAAFISGPDDVLMHEDSEDGFAPFWSIETRERPGPSVLIYRID